MLCGVALPRTAHSLGPSQTPNLDFAALARTAITRQQAIHHRPQPALFLSSHTNRSRHLSYLGCNDPRC